MLLEKATEDGVNAANPSGVTALHAAAAGGHWDVVYRLLHKGANTAVIDGRGRTPLHEAAKGGHDGMVRLLIKNNASINTADELGKTALHEAAEGGYESVVELLLERSNSLQNQQTGCSDQCRRPNMPTA